MSDSKDSILGCTLAELEDRLVSAGVEKFRAGQILKWIYGKRSTGFDGMTDLSIELRERLDGEFRIFTSTVERIEDDGAGNRKLLVRLADGAAIECVLMTERGRNVACLSSQAGCPVGCGFCASGAGGFERNLESHEIVEQALLASNLLPEHESLQGVMYMGMGEPMLNADAVFRSMEFLQSDWGLGIGRRHITLSTVGFQKGIEAVAERAPGIRLAVSLHSADETVRKWLVPRIGGSVAEVLGAVRKYQKKTGNRVTFEYVLVKGVNDTTSDAGRLAEALRGISCYVNLIPMNPVEGSSLEGPEAETAESFMEVLAGHGVEAHVRRSLGVGIGAGCGQLAGAKKKAE